MAAILATEGLTKNFGGLRAVNSVSLHFEEGKLTSVIGPNGAGKTTFFNLLTGLIKPDSGQDHFQGRGYHEASYPWDRSEGNFPLLPDHQSLQ